MKSKDTKIATLRSEVEQLEKVIEDSIQYLALESNNGSFYKSVLVLVCL